MYVCGFLAMALSIPSSVWAPASPSFCFMDSLTNGPGVINCCPVPRSAIPSVPQSFQPDTLCLAQSSWLVGCLCERSNPASRALSVLIGHSISIMPSSYLGVFPRNQMFRSLARLPLCGGKSLGALSRTDPGTFSFGGPSLPRVFISSKRFAQMLVPSKPVKFHHIRLALVSSSHVPGYESRVVRSGTPICLTAGW